MLVVLLVLISLVLPAGSPALAASVYESDFNGDGILDSGDANLLTSEIAAYTNDASFDLNNDGAVDLLDLDAWFSTYSGDSGVPLALALVDVNFDTVNTISDFQIIKSNLLVSTTDFTDGNLNADTLVDAADRELYISRGGVVPEPSAFILAALGTLGLLGYRRIRGK